MILLAVGTAPTAIATKHVTIAQLEQILDTLKGESDSRVARELTDLELTERASSMRLNRWAHEFPGRHAREAFTLLADASAFLSLHREDIPNIPAPDNAEQQAIFERAVAYPRDTITKLPIFYATRETTHFDDSPPRPPDRGWLSHIQGRQDRGRRFEYTRNDRGQIARPVISFCRKIQHGGDLPRRR